MVVFSRSVSYFGSHPHPSNISTRVKVPALKIIIPVCFKKRTVKYLLIWIRRTIASVLAPLLSSGHDRQTAPNTSVHHRNSTEHTNSLSNWKIKTSCELEKRNFRYIFALGKMAEWSIAAVLKTVELRGSGGSNPSLSATNFLTRKTVSDCLPFFCFFWRETLLSTKKVPDHQYRSQSTQRCPS